MDTVYLIEVVIGVVVVAMLGLFTLRDLIVRYPIYPAPFVSGGDKDDSDAERRAKQDVRHEGRFREEF
jgi:hypothetical protein